MRYRLCST